MGFSDSAVELRYRESGAAVAQRDMRQTSPGLLQTAVNFLRIFPTPMTHRNERHGIP